jgi:hypothetical protein
MPEQPKCRNANDPAAWYCYHWRGAVTPGRRELDTSGECGICALTSAWDGIGEAPSFLDPEEA